MLLKAPKNNPTQSWFVIVRLQLSLIITLIPHKKAWFDTKIPVSMQKYMVWHKKCSVRQKNARPSMHQLPLSLSNIPHLPLLRNIFFQFYSNTLFLRTHREIIYEKWNYIDIQIYLVSSWNMKVIIHSVCDAHNVCNHKCYWYITANSANFFSFDCSIKIWRTCSCAGSIMHQEELS